MGKCWNLENQKPWEDYYALKMRQKLWQLSCAVSGFHFWIDSLKATSNFDGKVLKVHQTDVKVQLKFFFFCFVLFFFILNEFPILSSYCRPNLAQSTFPWYETSRNEPITRSISRGDSLSLSKSYFCSKWAFWAARPVSKSLENFLVTVASAKTKWNFLYSIKYTLFVNESILDINHPELLTPVYHYMI